MILNNRRRNMLPLRTNSGQKTRRTGPHRRAQRLLSWEAVRQEAGAALRVRSFAACVLIALCGFGGCTSHSGQRADRDFVTSREGSRNGQAGPVITIDEGHHNFHTRTGRYAGFAAKLEAAGYSVVSLEQKFTAETLSQVAVLVISNALHPSSMEAWTAPTPSAFDALEVEAIVAWVNGGGRLLLIADHMPFPGAAEDLADAMGFGFRNGFLFHRDSENGTFYLDKASGLLNTSALGDFADPALQVSRVKVFTGQAFQVQVSDARTILRVPKGARLLMPEVAWEFGQNTTSLPAQDLAIGAIREVGNGRLAVFGEAAMFTAQIAKRDGRTFRTGMSDPEASGNAPLLRSVMAWLAAGLSPQQTDLGAER